MIKAASWGMVPPNASATGTAAIRKPAMPNRDGSAASSTSPHPMNTASSPMPHARPNRSWTYPKNNRPTPFAIAYTPMPSPA